MKNYGYNKKTYEKYKKIMMIILKNVNLKIVIEKLHIVN